MLVKPGAGDRSQLPSAWALIAALRSRVSSKSLRNSERWSRSTLRKSWSWTLTCWLPDLRKSFKFYKYSQSLHCTSCIRWLFRRMRRTYFLSVSEHLECAEGHVQYRWFVWAASPCCAEEGHESREVALQTWKLCCMDGVVWVRNLSRCFFISWHVSWFACAEKPLHCKVTSSIHGVIFVNLSSTPWQAKKRIECQIEC